jgi:hypothetical protein
MIPKARRLRSDEKLALAFYDFSPSADQPMPPQVVLYSFITGDTLWHDPDNLLERN